METYDLIVSLGGNCAAAYQMKRRGLRPFALPFDYLFMNSQKTIRYLSEGFKNGFKDFCLKENLREMTPQEKAAAGGDKDKFKYNDTLTDYGFIHHFKHSIADKNGYEETAAVFRRRINRLFDKINESKKILFLLETHFSYDISLAKSLRDAVQALYPDKEIYWEIIQFSSNTGGGGGYTDKNMNIQCYIRPVNNYDCFETNWEWAFLDNLSLSDVSTTQTTAEKKHKNEFKLFSAKFKNKRFKIKLFIESL